MPRDPLLRVAVLLFLVLTLLLFSLPIAADSNKKTKERKIKVCILNDQDSEASGAVIRDITNSVFQDYKERLQINFQVTTYSTYRGSLEWWPFDQGVYLAKACPKDCEVRIVFLNQKKRMSDLNPFLDDNDDIHGVGDPYYGFILVFETESRYDSQNRNGGVFKTLKHEIMHLFAGHWHSNDTNSFAFPLSVKNKGLWTEDVIEKINQNREKRWYQRN